MLAMTFVWTGFLLVGMDGFEDHKIDYGRPVRSHPSKFDRRLEASQKKKECFFLCVIAIPHRKIAQGKWQGAA